MAYTRAEINNKIRYYENLIQQYQNSANKSNTQISELISLKSKMQSYQRDFSNRETNRKNKVVNGFGGKFNFKFISSYVSGMKNLIAGSDYRRAYNSISSGISRVEKQISQLRSDAMNYNNKIRSCRNNITYWRNQLKYAKK